MRLTGQQGISALIFDMDGLMVDTEPIYWAAGRALARQQGKSVSDQTLRNMMGRGQLEAMEIFMRECGIVDGSPRELLVKRQELIIQGLQRGPIQPMPGLTAILETFKHRLKFAVATSAPRAFAELTLPKLQLDGYFQAIQTGDEIVNGKPDPEIYLKTMARLDVFPGQCVVLEDSRAGSLAGHRAGAKVIAVPSELTASEDFSFADARVENLIEAAKLIQLWMSDN